MSGKRRSNNKINHAYNVYTVVVTNFMNASTLCETLKFVPQKYSEQIEKVNLVRYYKIQIYATGSYENEIGL